MTATHFWYPAREEMDVTLSAGKGIANLVREAVAVIIMVNSHECTIRRSTISSCNDNHEATPLKSHDSFPERVEELVTSDRQAPKLCVWELEAYE